MNLELALQQQQITVPQGSWVGDMTMAGFGATLLVLSFLSIRGRVPKGAPDGTPGKPMFLWGPLFGGLMDRAVTVPSQRLAKRWWNGGDEGFDWKSLMTFLVGMWATTSILSSAPGTMLNLVEWFQGLLLAMKDWPLVSDFGAAGICALLGFLAMRNKDDDKADLIYGALSGIIWPLGGGWAAGVTLQIGNWIPHVMSLS